LAQAGGPDGAKADEALAAVRQNAIEEAGASREAEHAFAAEFGHEDREMRARGASVDKVPVVPSLRPPVIRPPMAVHVQVLATAYYTNYFL
jgi:hypothetical protein